MKARESDWNGLVKSSKLAQVRSDDQSEYPTL